MYTRIALGKNSAMDVVSGESSGGQGQLLILYPLLFALQLLEIWIGEHYASLTTITSGVVLRALVMGTAVCIQPLLLCFLSHRLWCCIGCHKVFLQTHQTI